MYGILTRYASYNFVFFKFSSKRRSGANIYVITTPITETINGIRINIFVVRLFLIGNCSTAIAYINHLDVIAVIMKKFIKLVVKTVNVFTGNTPESTPDHIASDKKYSINAISAWSYFSCFSCLSMLNRSCASMMPNIMQPTILDVT